MANNQTVKNNTQMTLIPAFTALLLILAFIVLLAWAPWMDDQEVYNKVVQHNPDGVKGAEDICGQPLTVGWFPFGRYVGNCEIGYFVTFWGEVSP